MKRIAIIGGGMAGLAAAHELWQLQRAGKSAFTWHLYERAPQLGGKVVTTQKDGFTVEGGPDSFLTQKPAGLELCRELGLEDELIPCNPGAQKIYVVVKGRLCALPTGFRLTVPTQWWPFIKSPLFSWRAKCRMALEPWMAPRRDEADESVAAFITRRLGREAADKIGGPLMAGIYVADPQRLSMMATFPQFRALERKYGSLQRGLRQSARQPGRRPPMFVSLRGGMQQLVDTMSAPWRDQCHCHTAITRLTHRDGTFRLEGDGVGDAYDHVILACPLHETAQLCGEVVPAAASLMRRVRYVSTATLSLAYRAPLTGLNQSLDGYGFVIPASERQRILACTWSSVKFTDRAPAGHQLMRVFIGGGEQEVLVEQDDAALVAIARDELRTLMGVESAPLWTQVHRWPQGNPQYDVGHPARMRAVMQAVADLPGLHVAGSGYQGIGLPDCIRSGRSAAAAAVDSNVWKNPAATIPRLG